MRIKNRFNELLAAKSRREDKKITQRMVMEATGLSAATITLYSTNRITRFDTDTVAVLCKFFDCTLGELLIFEEDDTVTLSHRRHDFIVAAV